MGDNGYPTENELWEKFKPGYVCVHSPDNVVLDGAFDADDLREILAMVDSKVCEGVYNGLSTTSAKELESLGWIPVSREAMETLARAAADMDSWFR